MPSSTDSDATAMPGQMTEEMTSAEEPFAQPTDTTPASEEYSEPSSEDLVAAASQLVTQVQQTVQQSPVQFPSHFQSTWTDGDKYAIYSVGGVRRDLSLRSLKLLPSAVAVHFKVGVSIVPWENLIKWHRPDEVVGDDWQTEAISVADVTSLNFVC